MKKKIAILSSSVRDGRLSHRVALFLQNYIETHSGSEVVAGIDETKVAANPGVATDTDANSGIEVDLIDLLEYDFPIFHERLPKMTSSPPAALLDYARRVRETDGLIVVSPVYNASFPASLKNAVDVLVDEWRYKPVLVASVTMGATAGISTVQQLQNLFLKMGARVAAPLYTVVNAGADFSETGEPRDPALAEKFLAAPLAEFMWLVEKSVGD